MRGFLRLFAVLGAGALGVGLLAACGDEPLGAQLEPAQFDTPARAGDVLVVYADSNLARQLEGPSAIDLTIGEGVPLPATTATIAWTTDAGQPDADDVRALATALGADGALDRDAAGAWSVGTSPDNSAGLIAGDYLGDSFTYMSAARWEQLLANPCDPTTTCPGPTGVPDQAMALAVAQRVLEALGIDRDDVDVATDVREDGLGVSVRSLVDGLSTMTEPDVELLIGSDGSVLQAGGRTNIADQSRTVDLIDAETALVRAERAFLIGAAVLASPTIAELPATTSLVPMTTLTGPGSVGASGDVGSTVATVIGFGSGHEVLWDVEGRRWIVPTFTISTDRNMLFTVFAISDNMVRVVDTPVGDSDQVGAGPELAPPAIEFPAVSDPSIAIPATGVPDAASVPTTTAALAPPHPGTTAAVTCRGTPPSDQPVMTVPPALEGPAYGMTRDEWGASMVSSISPIVNGLPTAEAVVLLEQGCWTVTVSYPGGPTTTITPDLRWDRIVLVDDGNGFVAAVVFD